VLNQPGLLQAEIVADGQVVAATGQAGRPWHACQLDHVVRQVGRYSSQRTFLEVYKLSAGWDAWIGASPLKEFELRTHVVEEMNLLARRAPYPEFHKRSPTIHVREGTVKLAAEPLDAERITSLQEIGLKRGGFPVSQQKVRPLETVGRLVEVESRELKKPSAGGDVIRLGQNAFHTLSFGENLSGFVGATFHCKAPARVYLLFDEILSKGSVNPVRSSCLNIVTLQLDAGTYNFESFEPYTLAYLKFVALDGDCEIENVYLREIAHPNVWKASFACSDDRLNRLFEAGRETFRQNSVDLFMDCPSRERAAWLCDSFFTARAAHCLTGQQRIEHDFLENFALPERFGPIPAGMLPMCYPADHRPNVFIPNWALWFVLQLEEYCQRGGDPALIERLEDRVLGLFDYFKPFLNDDGLLEGLEGWVFIEWSKANDFVQDVNYPTNMLYAAALQSAGKLYDRPDLLSQAGRVREVILRDSFDGSFFVDNAVRTDARLEPTRHRTETCQYYAFFFGIASPETHAELWQRLLNDFGPDRLKRNAFPEIHPSNAFIGNVLRLELLSQHHRQEQLAEEMIDYYLYMARQTGTLWENVHAQASCNHGFASHVVNHLYKDVLGVVRIDQAARQVEIRIPDVPLTWCRGRMPTPEGFVQLHWQRSGDHIQYELEIPAGYEVVCRSSDQLTLAPAHVD
jgi:alpha-L-rhamnosidase